MDVASSGEFRQFRQFVQLELRVLQPFLIGLGIRKAALDLLVFDDAALFGIDQQHLAGLQPPFAHDLLFRNRQNTRLRSHDDVIIVGDDEARGPQARCDPASRRSGGHR